MVLDLVLELSRNVDVVQRCRSQKTGPDSGRVMISQRFGHRERSVAFTVDCVGADFWCFPHHEVKEGRSPLKPTKGDFWWRLLAHDLEHGLECIPHCVCVEGPLLLVESLSLVKFRIKRRKSMGVPPSAHR